MFNYILSFFWKPDISSLEAPLSLDEAYNLVNESQEASQSKEEPKETDEIGPYEVSNKQGKITKICGDNMYVVDDTYEFKSLLSDLLLGTRISYQIIKSMGKIQVVDVSILENDWNVIDTGTRKWYERTLVCSVAKRDGRILTLTPGEISVNLNDVRSSFVPIVGDWVELEVKCEVDENVVDLTGKIIEINNLQPLRPQIKVGKITQWDPYDWNGVIDRNIFFNKSALYCGYLPVQNDKVVAEIIESNQSVCTWRALKVIPDYLHNKENLEIRGLNSEEIPECHPDVKITNCISLTFTKLGESKLFTVEIESLEEIKIICIELPKLNGQCRLTKTIDHHLIKKGQQLTIMIECKAKSIGTSQEVLIFHFENFKLKRWITINVAGEVPNNIKMRKNDTRKQVIPRTQRETIKGQRIHSVARFVPILMPDFQVPDRLYKLLEKGQDSFLASTLKIELEKMKPCLVTPLNYMNYEDKFHTLLHLDEIQTRLEMQNYDQERACFIRNGEYLLLEIENLAERRPSVIIGDRVIARNIHNSQSPDYEGYIHKVAKNHVYIKFSHIFHDSYNGEDYSIFIVASRVTYRRKHFAINLAVRNLGKEYLFPSRVVEKESQVDFIYDNYDDSSSKSNDSSDLPEEEPSSKKKLLEKISKFKEGNGELPVKKLEWHNKSLNFYQKEAIRNILLGVCRPLPYIIFGPPGTGKTITLVETILQILRLMPHSRLLVAAPSNSAADLIALRLIDSGVLKPGDLIRLVAVTAVPNISAKLAPYCATANIERAGTETSLPVVNATGLVLGYSSAVLGRHRITVSTCSSAGLLYSMGFSKGHFSHVIIDEGGQTSEPSVLIPLAFLDVSSGQAVLAGDPMQLGPVILSHFAADYGLEESFLERMVSRFPYTRDIEGFPKTYGYDPRLITKLLYNYRSLPNLLKLPSMLFYNDDLKSTISETDSDEAILLGKLTEILPQNKNSTVVPIVFHSVLGENFQTDDSPSWFNPSEAAQVFYYVNELYRLGVTSRDIGIITPYKAQAKQLMELFKEAEFDFPKVGTVEEFQGQEFNIIILSTVRSNKSYLSSDIKYTMGFISSPRRLNVSITRAKALLIIVGNGNLLIIDRCWRSVINYCIDMNSFIGAPIS